MQPAEVRGAGWARHLCIQCRPPLFPTPGGQNVPAQGAGCTSSPGWRGRCAPLRMLCTSCRKYVITQLAQQLRPELEAAVKKNDLPPGEAYSPAKEQVGLQSNEEGFRVWARTTCCPRRPACPVWGRHAHESRGQGVGIRREGLTLTGKDRQDVMGGLASGRQRCWPAARCAHRPMHSPGCLRHSWPAASQAPAAKDGSPSWI